MIAAGVRRRRRRLGWLPFVLALAWAGQAPAAGAHGGGKPVHPVNVLLVHGFTDTGAIFDPLVEVLRQHGCRCFAPTLQPNDFRGGVHDLTTKLSAAVEGRFGKAEPFVVVALSMGGLIARDYIQNLRRGKRVRALFLISTANRGTVWANFSPGGGARDFAIGNPFLRALNADVSAYKNIPVQAYWTPFDIAVAPSVNSRCFFGQNRRVLAPFHQSMVKHPEVMADIAARIDALAVRPFANGKNGR